MASAATDFNAPDYETLLKDEKSVRDNYVVFRERCRDILKQRNLPLAFAAYDHYLELNEGEKRKDDKTPAEQHVQMHIVLLDALLKSLNNKLGYGEEHGSIDALFAALILHDTIEDNEQEPEDLARMFHEAILKMNVNEDTRADLAKNAQKAVSIVCLISRNYPLPDGRIPDRSEYRERWLENPAAALIKMLDTINKLATMTGVDAFEKDNQKKMKANVDEAQQMFGDSFQAAHKRAMETYTGTTKLFDRLDAVLAITLREINGYIYYSSADYAGNPRIDKPYRFNGYIGKAKSILKYLYDGENPVLISAKRMESATQYPNIPDFYLRILKPALAPLMEKVDPSSGISKTFAGVTDFAWRLITRRPKREPAQ